jgi:hypothetical protein
MTVEKDFDNEMAEVAAIINDRTEEHEALKLVEAARATLRANISSNQVTDPALLDAIRNDLELKVARISNKSGRVKRKLKRNGKPNNS